MQWVPRALSLGVKRPGREAEHSPRSSAEVKEFVELYLHSPNTPSWRGAYLSTGTTLPLPLSPERAYVDNINMDLRELGIYGANWIQLAQNRVQWRAFVNTVMILRVP
jgi:hypothetical protein